MLAFCFTGSTPIAIAFDHICLFSREVTFKARREEAGIFRTLAPARGRYTSEPLRHQISDHFLDVPIFGATKLHATL